MAITVNTNISSINAQRNLTKSTSALDKAMQRLSSGLRINSAADDAAGLAISTGITSQVNGLTQAEQNANDGLSVVGTAEGALTTETTILQRIRELAVQAANDINSTDDREAIQDEIDAQVEELTRLGNTTTFNGINLLDGSFSNKKLQVGAYSGQTISVSLGDFRAAAMGSIATTTGTAVTSVAFSGANFRITNQPTSAYADIAASESDGVSAYNANASAIAKASAINASTSVTGVTATVNATTTGALTAMGTGTILAGTLSINGVAITSSAIAVQASDASGTLTAAINAQSSKTGVTASISGTSIVLTAADGRNIRTVASGTAVSLGGFTTGTTDYGGTITLNSNDAFTISGTTGATGGVAAGGFGTTTPAAIALDTTKNVDVIDVTTQSSASTAILIVDSALNAVADAEASLGALSNRLDNTISNIEVANENLSAANSRIQDTDFAVETANMTRAQIIQQSSVAVLTQANSRPQIALTLLGA